MTPTQKREQTMIQRYGTDWRKVIGRKSKAAAIEAAGGVDGYTEIKRKAGAAGGRSNDPSSRYYSTHPEAAAKLAKLGAAKRWGN